MLEIRDLQVVRGKQTILDIPSLAFHPGKLYALIGDNGAGKTTLLECISGLTVPRRGAITWRGRDITGAPDSVVGIVLQRPVLFAGSVLSNVEYGLKCRGVKRAARREKALQMLKTLDMERFAYRSRRQLSGGELQYVAIARTLALEPEVLLLDEPFSHLDSEGSARLVRLLRRVPSERTLVIFSTHHLEKGLFLADEVIALKGGEITPPPVANIIRGASKRTEHGMILETPGGMTLFHIDEFEGDAVFKLAPSAITLARTRQTTSARNQFQAEITGMQRTGSRIQVELTAEFPLQVLLTNESWNTLQFHIGERVWVSFKASALQRLDV